MDQQAPVQEYKCPCCNAGLRFDGESQQLTCAYCDNTFELETVKAYQDSSPSTSDTIHWDEESKAQQWSEQEHLHIHAFQCPSCGGEIITEETTAATFCPFCDNPTIMPSRLSGGLKPDAVLPFVKTKEDAKAAFLNLCKGKPLLPKDFTHTQRLEKITGMYVPFWLYDCDAEFNGSYNATRIHRWSDSRYNYTKTDHFLLQRGANAAFSGIPMDGSSKMEDAFMESIEPYDYTTLEEFSTEYLTGYFADKYDVPSEQGEDRIRQRVTQSIHNEVQTSLLGYATAIPTSSQLTIDHSKARYVLLPVWMLNTKYNGKIYTFAMNGQTGKMTGSFPACPKRSAAWFTGISAAVAVFTTVLQLLF